MDQESPVKIISATDVTYSVDSAILALEISNDFLLQVRREGKSLLEEINKGICGNAITLDKNSTRLQSTLEKTVGKLFTKFTRAKGGTERKRIKDGKTRVTVSCGETVDSIAMEDRLQQAEAALTEAAELKDLEDEALSLLLEEEKREKERLKSAIGCTKNAGKTFDEVGVRQKQRKLSQIKTYASSTLEPCMESYGLTPTTLTAHTSSGVPVTIPLSNSLTVPSSSTENPSTSSNVSEAACTLYLLDHFGVSDQFYHELAQLHPSIPRLHHVKGLRQSLNSDIETIQLPPPYIGKYMHFRETLTKTITSLLATSDGPIPERIILKLSGDGANIAASASMVFLTFSFPGLCENVLSAAGNHTFASVKGPEDYDFLKPCFKPVWEEIGEVISHPNITIMDEQCTLDIVFGSDYKVMTGLNKANSTYACVWCTVSKEQRWDMSVSEETYTSSPPSGKSRTLASLKQNCHYSKADKHLGSKHPPLLELEPSSYVLDELHLLLRVSDVLIRNLIYLADQLDRRQKQRDGAHGNHMQTLQNLVNYCGVQFKVTQVHNENGKAVSGMYEWTSLNRSQNLLVLKKLPDKLQDLLEEDDAAQISALLKDFLTLYSLISSHAPCADEIHRKGKQWVKDFVALGRFEGFQRKFVTPYMHCMVYHVPHQIRRFGNLLQFSGQGVEKNNDAAKHHFYSSNRHDPCGEVLRTEKRLEQLETTCRREKRQYIKCDAHYWSHGISESRAAKRLRRSH